MLKNSDALESTVSRQLVLAKSLFHKNEADIMFSLTLLGAERRWGPRTGGSEISLVLTVRIILPACNGINAVIVQL